MVEGWGLDVDQCQRPDVQHQPPQLGSVRLHIPGIGFGVWGLGFRVSDFEFQVSGFKFWVWGCFAPAPLGFRVHGLELTDSGFGVEDWWLRVGGWMLINVNGETRNITHHGSAQSDSTSQVSGAHVCTSLVRHGGSLGEFLE